MNHDDDRLMRCFTLAFPRASRDELRTAKFEAVLGWDSLRGVTLLAILGEEFGLRIDLSELLELETFDSVKSYLLQHGMMSRVNE